MKKLLAVFCCILFFRTFAQVAPGNELAERKVSGQKVLIKALAVIANTEGYKKAPAKKVQVAFSGSPFDEKEQRETCLLVQVCSYSATE